MPEYLSPGVYVEEIAHGPRPIEGVSTSTAGFLGLTRRGPLEPQVVTSFGDFQRRYGGFMDVHDSALPIAVEGFFVDGGKRCHVARVAARDATSMRAVIDAKIGVTAIGPGTWPNRIAARID